MGQTEDTESFYRDSNENAGADDHMLEDPMMVWPKEKKSFSKNIFSRPEAPFIIMGIGLVALVVIFFIIAPKGRNENVNRQVSSLSDRVGQVENKINDMEARLEGLAKIENEIALLNKAMLRFENVDASTSLRMDRITTDFKALQKEFDEVNGHKTGATGNSTSSVQAGTAHKVQKTIYHQVRSGETLYSISRRYNLTVDSLRRLNGLSNQAAIYPGQKLKVKASGD